jgi:hypothetical protein
VEDYVVKLVLIEGTPEEVLSVAKGLEVGAASSPSEASLAATTADVAPGERVFVSTDVARKVLSRRPLSHEQKTVLTILAKRHPGWVPAAELQAATGYSTAQFAGLMGAFGRRFSHTEGFAEGSLLFDFQWNYEKGAYDYRLPDTVLEAMKAEKLI